MVAEAKVGTDATCSAGHEDLARAARSVPEGHAASVSTLASDTSSTALSAAMFMLYGDEIVYLFSGSDEKYMRDYNAQYLIQWHMIKYAADHGFKRYNFYGIHGLPDDNCPDGIYDFKKGFTTDETGRVIELIGTFEAPLDPTVSKMYHLLLRLHH
jgi:lipid II:glycine glycyltransferase (peptidoglycan interpeptide bridge formation enzyme)